MVGDPAQHGPFLGVCFGALVSVDIVLLFIMPIVYGYPSIFLSALAAGSFPSKLSFTTVRGLE